MIEISKYLIGKEISIWLIDLCRKNSILVSFVYIQSFDKFKNFIRISFSKSKTCIKTHSLIIHSTGVTFEIAECYFKISQKNL